jgi:hypothetical protein
LLRRRFKTEEDLNVTISVQFSTVSLAGTNSVISMLGFLSVKPTLYPGGAVTSRFSFSRSALAADAPKAARMIALCNNAACVFDMARIPRAGFSLTDGAGTFARQPCGIGKILPKTAAIVPARAGLVRPTV